jgi:hypothetical protein
MNDIKATIIFSIILLIEIVVMMVIVFGTANSILYY